MKVVHLCLASFFPDHYSYQENMLPKFHKEQGHEVEVIASLVTFDENGKATLLKEANSYRNEYDIPVTRLEYKSGRLNRRLRYFVGFAEALEKAAPDILFIHGCQFCDIRVVVKYLRRHPNVKVFVDNHADFSNSATNWLSRHVLHGMIWRRCAHLIEPYTQRFYGVLPIRVDFLRDIYKLPPEKCELLVMGADDDAVTAAAAPEVRREIRAKYQLKDNDFVIMTGGKIDAYKTQTLLLMEAVRRINRPDVKLIVFGSVTPELKERVNALADGNTVQYIGWVQAKDSYRYFAAADLVVFPGRHSVFWEQVAAQGIPMLCKAWDGTTHVDVGGNVRFLTQDSVDEIEAEILRLVDSPETFAQMRRVAENEGKKYFLYSDIAKRSIS